MLPLNQIKPTLAIILALVSLTNYAAPTSAQPNRSHTNRFDNIQISFLDGTTRGRPGRRSDTGSRDGKGCPSTDTPIIALMPQNHFGLTLEQYPTFWFYIPYKPDQITSAKFVLRDQNSKEIYQTSLSLVGTPGLVSFSLPPVASLEVNNQVTDVSGYQWDLILYCGSQDFSLRGWVQRITRPDLERQLQTATPRERIALYAENSIWYTALNDLAKLRISQPQNRTLAQDWTNLLKDVGLETLANKPIVGSIQFNSTPERRQ